MTAGLQGRVLIVAGSDPSGGAGIQADIKTVTALGGYAAAAISALTVQNTLGVSDVMAVPPAFVGAQIKAVLDDIGADCLKTGMLYGAPTIEATAQAIEDCGYKGPIVVDPVMVATSGDALLQPRAVDALKQLLIKGAALVTPNIPEAEALTGLAISSKADMARAGEAILALGCEAVLVKGGHLPGGKLVDLLLSKDGLMRESESLRIDTRHTHGTGCTLASAVATGLSQGLALEDAYQQAQAYVRRAIQLAPGLGSGHGPLGHAAAGYGAAGHSVAGKP
jgi:hydroxymethylpyrimidine/phosphomethylpyrimidine kinase